MAKVTGNSVWDALKGKKETATEKVEINFGDVEAELTVKFRDVDVIQEIEEEYDKKMPRKPKKKVDLGHETITIEVPSEEDKYKVFNDCDEAKEWEEKAKPIQMEKLARTAYAFLVEEDRPDEDAKKGTKILLDRLRIADITKIMQAGMKLIGFDENIKKQS